MIFCTAVVDETQMIKKNKSPEFCSSELCVFDLSIIHKKTIQRYKLIKWEACNNIVPVNQSKNPCNVSFHWLQQQPWASCLHTCASVTKQYNLVPVPANGRWCSAAVEVTAGLAESNGMQPAAGLMASITCGLTAEDRDIRSFRVWDYRWISLFTITGSNIKNDRKKLN